MTTTIEPLTAQDRCDRCGAAAVLAFNPKNTPGMLLMCGHHVLVHKDAIRVSSEMIWNERGQVIYPKPKSSVAL